MSTLDVIDTRYPQLTQWLRRQQRQLAAYSPVTRQGQIIGISGILLESSLPNARIGDLCLVERSDSSQGAGRKSSVSAPETPSCRRWARWTASRRGPSFTPLYQPHCVQFRCTVRQRAGRLRPPLEEGGHRAFVEPGDLNANPMPVIGDAPPPTERPRIADPCPPVMRAIDGLLTIRLRPARRGVRRRRLRQNHPAGGTGAQHPMRRHCVRLNRRAWPRTARISRSRTGRTATQPHRAGLLHLRSQHMERARAAFTATAIAEAFRAAGKQVLLIIDSLTRFARAQREIGLALGEPQGRGGLPPSVYTLLPRLVERAGQTRQGAITALYSVLIEQDSMNDPVADEVRSLIDGHIVLSRRLAERNHYPAIDVLMSLSRTMSNVVEREHTRNANAVRRLMAAYKQVEMLIRLGEYQPGHDAFTDAAVSANDDINRFLQQAMREPQSFDFIQSQLAEVSQYANL
uniref:protein-secreting ATPase n=1 Tax=Dickeya chrysanthemi TaxID=556 RepID=Q84BB2_DICCH|nr:HrcN [Dickeya chrysanthemi]